MSSPNIAATQPSESMRSGILNVSLSVLRDSGLSLPVAAKTLGPGGLADQDTDKRPLLYAIVEYENYQFSIEAKMGRRNSFFFGLGRSNPLRFDVTTYSDLIVHLIVKNSSGSAGLVPVGLVKLNPFAESFPSKAHWVNVQNGNGKILIEAQYVEKSMPPLEDKMVWWTLSQNTDSSDLWRIEKKDVDQRYAMKVLSNADVASELEIKHPLIAPIRFSFRTSEQLSLLSSVASGGCLFSHLQKIRRFDADISRLYAAELLCVLEYLHERGITFACLKPENILVDAFGHISICKPDLFTLDADKSGHILPGTPEIPAPELLLDREPSRMADFWSIGVFFYEMLTGLPPFYHKDPEEQRRRITNEDLKIDAQISSDTVKILTGLLEKDPSKRLGANGALEVKAHAFFRDIDWDDLLHRRTYAAYLQPDNAGMLCRVLDQSPENGTCTTRMRRQVSGIIYEEEQFLDLKWWKPIEPARDIASINKTENSAAQDDDGWEIAWEPVSKEFYFHNRITDEKCQVDEKLDIRELAAKRLPPPPPSTATNGSDNLEDCNSPTENKQISVLAAALKGGYSNRVIKQILEYSVNLNVGLLKYDLMDAMRMPKRIDGLGVTAFHQSVTLTPLEWAVEHGNIGLVHMFLDNGSDANYTPDEVKGPSIVKAVRIGNQRLVDILVKISNRVSSTRALRLAVELRDVEIAKMLLSAGVCCDFKLADLPPPPGDGCYFGGSASLQAWHFTSPLSIAARSGDIDLVRLLLAHGADANAGYHLLTKWKNAFEDRVEIRPVHFSCGRPVQVAMEMGHSDVVKVLIEEGGADIWLPQPVSNMEDHTCSVIPRDVYLRVTAEIEAVAAKLPREASQQSADS
ncbi:kinase-like protein [Nemania abortiva]|nr:kinase-like protein [Nemania abortiva]